MMIIIIIKEQTAQLFAICQTTTTTGLDWIGLDNGTSSVLNLSEKDIISASTSHSCFVCCRMNRADWMTVQDIFLLVQSDSMNYKLRCPSLQKSVCLSCSAAIQRSPSCCFSCYSSGATIVTEGQFRSGN